MKKILIILAILFLIVFGMVLVLGGQVLIELFPQRGVTFFEAVFFEAVFSVALACAIFNEMFMRKAL